MEKKLDVWLDSYEKDTGFSGIVEIVSKGEAIFKKYVGYADRENHITFSDDTKFKLYSMTKPIVAIAIMKLYEQGKIDLDEHPKKYLDCAKNLDSRITIKFIMQHSSGIPEIASVETMRVKRDVDLCYEIENVSKKELLFEPGKGTSYTNTNYILLALIVEKFCKMPFSEYLETSLFNELGMTSACCDTGKKVIENMAVGYDKIDDDIVVAEYVNMALIHGAGFSVGTVKDVEALYDVVKNRKVLKNETWDLVLTPSDISPFGFGCTVFDWNDKLVYQHNGGHIGFRSLHRYLPNEDFAIIILSNSGFGNAREEISEKTYEIYFGASQNLELPEMDKGFASVKK